MYKYIVVFISLIFLAGVGPGDVGAEKSVHIDVPALQERAPDKEDTAIKMLGSIIELKKSLSERMAEKNQLLETSSSETEKAALLAEISKLDKQLAAANADFERIATGIDIGLFTEKKEEQFDWKDELLSLVKPGITEMKRLTIKARQKTKLKDELSAYQDLVPVVKKANENLQALISKATDKQLKADLESLVPEWEGVGNQIKNKLDLVEMQLLEITEKETSLLDGSKKSIKNFFKTRGLILFIAIMAVIGLVLLLRVSYLFLIKFIPGSQARYRPFHVRAIGLLYRVMTLVLVLLALILVFYMFEDWVLLSLSIILLIGLGWGAKHTLPQFWLQSRLMLNIGPVREGERIFYQGVPWLVKNINMFSTLENPSLGVILRLPIGELMDKTSREFDKNEPWFPCRKNDWVLLADNTWGCVVSLSHELVELVQRGGGRKVYQTRDFLAQSPLNLSVDFRLKVLFGISYTLQADATGRILEITAAYLREQIAQEGYEPSLVKLSVEFAQAGASSLDFVVIADFKGELAPMYRPLERAIQRWCVDLCTQNNWEIPFPQLTVHKGP